MTTQMPVRLRITNAARAAAGRRIRVLGHLPARLTLVTLVAVAAIGVGAGFAFARSSAPTIGTGVVVIDTKLGVQGGAAAGTGIVLTPSGEVLTNNHVIRGATSVEVVVPGSTHHYSAKVVGYDVSADVAVLQLSGASNLKTASLGDSSKVMVGQTVVALGNAGGTGTLTPASGTVTGVAESITVSDDQGGSERLTGLIETDAALQPGDSGGPLMNAKGKVIGVDSAAATGFTFRVVSASDSYAIPINTAVRVAKQIESGNASSTVHIGPTPFLGVQIASTVGSRGFGQGGLGSRGTAPAGGLVAGVVPGGPAAAAGLTAGDVIAAINGHTVSSPSAITSLILTKKPGAKIKVTYTDQSAASHVTTVILGSGPPQ
jgi:S1-C subfamily serine protease